MLKKTLIAVAVTVTGSLFSINSMANDCLEHAPLGYPDKADQILCKDGYVIGYNYNTRNPDWVAYHITKESVSAYRKRINTFTEDEMIPMRYRSLLSDYRNSGYDRGHLAPNATMDFSIRSQKQSFQLSNMVPQLPKHNRNGWKELEKFVREWTKERGELYVVSGVLYDDNRTFIGSGVEIPDYFYKVILDPAKLESTAFLIPHQGFGKEDIKKFNVSIDEIEAITGLDFFNELDNATEASFEGDSFYWGDQ